MVASGVAVVLTLAPGPGAILTPYTLDDGSTGTGGFRKIYPPAEFGVHWYELRSIDYAGHACPRRYTFVVEPSSVTTSTTTTSVPSSTTTGPDTTTTVG